MQKNAVRVRTSIFLRSGCGGGEEEEGVIVAGLPVFDSLIFGFRCRIVDMCF